jgi:hypothetical protein
MRPRSPEELQDFLRLCIDPGPGRDKRTPLQMADSLPESHQAALYEMAPPYLHAFAVTADSLTRRAEEMRHAYAAALLAWLRGDLSTDHALELVEQGARHTRQCPWCTHGVLSATCEEGRRLAAAFLAPHPADGTTDRAAGEGR